MRALSFALVALFIAGAANAGIPLLNVTCANSIEVHADQGGPVYINGTQARLKKFNDNYYEASSGSDTISIATNPDGTPSVSYTGKHGAHGVCSPAESSSDTAAPDAPGGIPMFNARCPGGVEIHADQGGPIYVNGKEATLKKFSDTYFEARGDTATISVSINPDGSPAISYTGPHGANGVCQKI